MKRLLVANRGEIACRIFRSARELGLETVAVYSEADSMAPHVLAADQAICIGPAAAAESYLVIDKIIDAAKRSGSDAIHPGYGFLSENADFAQAVSDAKLNWVGPPPSAISSMGDKAAAKRHMKAAKVPIAPGCELNGDEDLIAAADAIGYPLLVKATAGGGGRGIRQVNSSAELEEAVARARSEAGGSFGNDSVMLERLIESAHHVEIQILADKHGTVLHLFDRDCSLQRRRQKIIEEAPSPIVGENLRNQMGSAAVNAAKATGYEGAGTVEFLVGLDGAFYFLEMNTRLQVEHPVTEMICGIDLVSWQLRIAMGEKLPWSQEDIKFSGHSIEARICAEDPSQNHLPCVGPILQWMPTEMKGVRIDAGIAKGQTIGAHYDSMLGKIIAWGADRETARRRLQRAIVESSIIGFATNRSFLKALLDEPAFRDGSFDTGFVDRFEWNPPETPRHAWLLASVLLSGLREGWGSRGNPTWSISLRCGAQELDLRLSALGSNRFEIERISESQRHLCVIHSLGLERYRISVDGWDRSFTVAQTEDAVYIDADGHVFEFTEPNPAAEQEAEEAACILKAPMQGKIIAINAQNGDVCDKGFSVFVIEAMKMEHPVVMPQEGTVVDVSLNVGDLVSSGQIIGRIEPLEES